MERKRKYTGEETLQLLDMASSDDIKVDELTEDRIRAIYARFKYCHHTLEQVAADYDFPISLIKDIKEGKKFAKIIKDI